ncbi:MAG TPA: 5'-nucleotidase [Chitinophagaceae bacterium]|nr:5'-nucleotidase [Chitinophagaceae bacterium]
MRKSAFYPLLVAVLFAVSCNTTYKAESVHYSNYRVQQSTSSNAVTAIMKPYADTINKLMNVVIGYNESRLEKKKPGNTLGYFIADAYLEMARQKIDPDIDAAFMNSGGIRLPDLPAGAITQGKLFELMPFDNLMVILKIKGSLLNQYLDTLAATEGLIESGITMQVGNRTTQQILIAGKPLDPDADYTIVHSDYVVINTNLLKNIARKTTSYLLRDAIIDYVKYYNSQGKKIKVLNTDRVFYVN